MKSHASFTYRFIKVLLTFILDWKLEGPLIRMKALGSSKVQGLWSLAAMLSLIVWFITSFLTLFMDKYTLSVLGVEAFLFCMNFNILWSNLGLELFDLIKVLSLSYFSHLNCNNSYIYESMDIVISIFNVIFPATIQIAVSTIMGFGNMFYPCYMGKKSRDWSQRSKKFYYDMCFVGMTRQVQKYLSTFQLLIWKIW